MYKTSTIIIFSFIFFISEIAFSSERNLQKIPEEQASPPKKKVKNPTEHLKENEWFTIWWGQGSDSSDKIREKFTGAKAQLYTEHALGEIFALTGLVNIGPTKW